MKISVIIPVYNVESYIVECVTSVLAQDYNSMEVILVNDGSSDSSGSICDAFAEKDNRVKVIHKPNSGLSDARNISIASATGEYVLFLDGDDFWADSHAVSTLVSRVKRTNADVLNFSYIKWFEDTDKKQPYFNNVAEMPEFRSVAEQVAYLAENGLYIASACNKMIRRSLLDQIPFESGISSEDIPWCAKLMLSANSMDFTCVNFYMYRQRAGSIRHTINDKKCDDLANGILSCIRLAEAAPADKKSALLHYAAFQFGTFFLVQAQTQNPQPDQIAVLSPYKYILRHHGRNKKLVLLNIACRTLGFPQSCAIIRTVYNRIKK